jgi:peptidyl-prolyl cis-trans isomerase A (cyclophilin A)
MLSSGFTKGAPSMKKWIAIALLAGLAACSSTTEKTEPAETAAPAAEPAPEPPPAEPPAAPAAADAPKEAPAAAPAGDKAPPKADTKPADKAATKTGVKLKPGLYAHFETSMGNFTAELNEKEAPITVANFAGLAGGTLEWTDPKTGQKQKRAYYDGLTFHRIMGPAASPPNGFMIQGGDPLGTGTGGPGFTIKDEFNSLKHDKAGVMAMARTDAPDSAGSQFYITLTATPFLDGRRVAPYVVFGQVIEGLEVVQKIGRVPTGPGDRPVENQVIKKIRIERVK